MRHYTPPDDVAGTVLDPTSDTFGPIIAALQSGEFETAATLTAQLSTDGADEGLRAVTPKRVALADLLSAHEAALLAGVTYSHWRVLLSRGQVPLPVRTDPAIWLRQDVEGWKKTKG